jgi:hypothetical protein
MESHRERLRQLDKERLAIEKEACDKEIQNLDTKWSQWQNQFSEKFHRTALYSNQSIKLLSLDDSVVPYERFLVKRRVKFYGSDSDDTQEE